MIYKCRDCGAPFNVKDLSTAIDEKKSTIICKHCGALNKLPIENIQDVVQAFLHLSEANFSKAQDVFTRIIDKERKGENVSSSAFLGLALAEFHVQTIYSDDVREGEPTLVCHIYNSHYLEDNEMFSHAVKIAEEANDFQEKENLSKYAEFVDAIKDKYDSISKEGTAYMSFVAYEDAPKDKLSESGCEMANDVYNKVMEDMTFSIEKSKITNKTCNIFLPQIQDSDYNGNDPVNEAKILYAIDHSESMLVITDNSIDSRLRSVYSRFFNRYKNGARIGFICYTQNNEITLPDNSRSKNVFEPVKNDNAYKKVSEFVARWNDIALVHKHIDDTNTYTNKVEKVTEFVKEPIIEESDGIPVLINGYAKFGLYPQTETKDVAVRQFFADKGEPERNDPKGWSVLYKSVKGNPCAWYIDDFYEGKKYRCVFFNKLRVGYSVRGTGEAFQRHNKYNETSVYYCFEFEPIVWTKIGNSGDYSVLVTEKALDSMEFNALETNCRLWEKSTLRVYLNGKFIDYAFSETQSNFLRGELVEYSSVDKVFLLDRKSDSKFFSTKMIRCSDYFKCVGGRLASQGGIQYFWVLNRNESTNESVACVASSYWQDVADEETDCTSVAILPKIVIRTKEN